MKTRRMKITAAAAPPEEVASFRFMDLPPELRLTIYEFAFALDVVHKTSAGQVSRAPGCFYPWRGPEHNEHSRYDRNAPTQRPLVLATSAEIRKEALPLFYRAYKFVFRCGDMMRVLKWLLLVGRGVELKSLSCGLLPPIADCRSKTEDITIMAFSLLRQLHGFKLSIAEVESDAESDAEWDPESDASDEYVVTRLEEIVTKRLAKAKLSVTDVEGKGIRGLMGVVRRWYKKPKALEGVYYEIGDDDYVDEDYVDEEDGNDGGGD